MMICDPDVVVKTTKDRRTSGLDTYDEVWEGVPIIMSLPNDEHQDLVTTLCAIIRMIFGIPGPHHVRAGVNVSDRVEQWMDNYRCPDVAVYLEGNPATNCGTHWCGGPDFLVEIISPGDPTREKFPFYAAVKSREVLVIDRDPWTIELHRLDGDAFGLVGTSTLSDTEKVISDVLPLSFQLVAGTTRPQIEIVHCVSGQKWTI